MTLDPQMMISRCITLISLLLVATLATGQDQRTSAAQKAQVAASGSYAKSIDQFTKRNPKKRRLFGNAAGEEGKQDQWREFNSATQMVGLNLDESSTIWLKDGKVVVAYFSFTSPSGDWYHFVDYYFRADGTLAKIHSQLNTFFSADGGLSVVREKFYGANGKLLHTSTRYLDPGSWRPRKRGEFMDEPIPLYKTIRDLPFAKLLRS
jgi:hypothetical protein